jgi:hypothetical protein
MAKKFMERFNTMPKKDQDKIKKIKFNDNADSPIKKSTNDKSNYIQNA